MPTKRKSKNDFTLQSPSPGKPVPADLVDPQTLTAAIQARIKHYKKVGNECSEYAARALLACLRVGDIVQVADALIEHFVALDDDDE